MRGLFIFDLDGTLFRGDRATVAAVNEAFDDLDLARPDPAEICSYFGRPIHEFHAWLRGLAAGREIESVLSRIERREAELVPTEGELFPGVRSMLERFAVEGFRLAICSNGRDPYVRTVLASHGIAGFFDAVRVREIEAENKTIMARDLLARIETRPAIVIGDRRDDIEAGRANGALTIGCAYGFGSREEIAAADAVVASAKEIPGAVHRILSGR
jgi:phosphoglycolate phosphatase